MMTGLGAVGVALMAAMMGGMLLTGKWMHKGAGHGAKEPTAQCPVSGNRVAVSSSAVQATVGGKLYYFDDEEHLRLFVLEPERFLGREGKK